ncbi:hypothetical protein [Actinokineospora xionganensis]|uniref:Uncharacterized protein n=1 Tax=Actinokineospora xionganensis TaxID=2684470 RepID=A0ABR7L2B3_9PSEU|nr:hypothetical protein [Actinokineospora xionganensis]MBC6446837.1 hypothetical protein [Actinokineospora xionganensis]
MGHSKSVLAVATAIVGATLVSGATASAVAPRPAAPSELQMGVAAAVAEGGTRFVSMPPQRVLDTRNATGVPGTSPVGPGGEIAVSLDGKVPADAVAVVLNVTGTAPTSNTYVTVWATGVARPTSSNLNLAPGQTRPNAVISEIGLDGKISFFNNAGTTHLIADLAGYYTKSTTGSSPYTTVAPVRVIDTRTAVGAIPGGQSITVDFTGKVADSATAVTLNLTGVDASQDTFITAWPTGAARPTASSLNLAPGEATPNQVTVALSADRKASFFNNAGTAHLIVDLAGFYSPASTLLFYPFGPIRSYDTRAMNDGLESGQFLTLIYDHLPMDVKAMAYNVTATNVNANTFVTVWPAGLARPTASNLNLAPGQTAPNMATVGVGVDPRHNVPGVSFYDNSGHVDLVVDISGFFG